MSMVAIVASIIWILGWSPDFAAGLKAYEHRDFAEALKEWLPLAKDGNASAQFNVGLLYYEGQGVPQDFSEAAKWFQESADRGYVKAQYNLGGMYGSGTGIKRDYTQAYKWLSLCASSGDEKCVAQRDLVARKLHGPKLAAAQQLTRDWQKKQ